MKGRKKFICSKPSALEYEYCMKPDAFVDGLDFLTNEEHERLQKYQQIHMNKRNDLVRAKRRFEKDLQEAAQKEIKRLLSGGVDIDEEYEHMEFMTLLGFSIDSNDQSIRMMDVDIWKLAEVLEVPIPPKITERWNVLTEEGIHPIRWSDTMERKLDAIMEKLGIELSD